MDLKHVAFRQERDSPSPRWPDVHRRRAAGGFLDGSVAGEAYDYIDLVVGILHRPSFERALAANRHLADRPFGEVVLTVCAVASKYSDDPRVFLDQAPRDDERSAGWKWFAQVRPTSATFDQAQAFLQLQRIVAIRSLVPSPLAHSPARRLVLLFYLDARRVLVPCRCRVALPQSHRRGEPEWYQRPSLTPLDAELYKRVFWMLVFWEFKGRVGAITSFDAPPPTTLDYEY
uniref:Xylanolytic transcriptional activator regulatory domain-containing protein n=1 Tax=Mycena chlorophos TaxID=658473 RepID=A0ABQ0LCP3_MYCCL|nr:predicted protein [Mycena chlorophos]